MEHFSNDLSSFFGYSLGHFHKERTIDFLVPLAVKGKHIELFEHFIETGESAFYQKARETFFADFQGFNVPFEFFFDMSFLEDFRIYCFCMKHPTVESHIFLDAHG
jgi:hypothetical protein